MKLPLRVNKYLLEAHTPLATIEYACEECLVETKYLEKFINKLYFDKLCEEGCPNYGNKWSCPPYAPDYTKFVENYKFINVFMLYIELKQFDYIKQEYLKVKAANSILKSRIDKALRNSMNDNEFYISTGSCRLCKSCKKKVGKSCAYPERRTYSFEALGINVSLLSADIFHRDLLWYKAKSLPEYTSVVAGLLTNNEVTDAKVIEQLLELK